MSIEKRMEEIARKKGMKTTKQVQEERVKKINEKKKKKPGLNYLLNLCNKKIVLIFLDNEKIEGILNSFNNYEICLETQEIKELIILKHSIKCFYEKNGGK